MNSEVLHIKYKDVCYLKRYDATIWPPENAYLNEVQYTVVSEKVSRD